jgi:DNA-directed RNA polymerase specialized sigma24 family protein
MNDVTQILSAIEQGDAGAAEELLPLVYKKRLKHGGGRLHVDLEAAGFLAKEPPEDLEAIDEALTRLAAEDPAKAALVKLRFFAGLTMPEIARVLKISLAIAECHWTYARTWLFAELKDRGNSANP